MNITIDGKSVEIYEDDNNIVDAADRVKISIPAPCYRTKRMNGCCNACVVEVDGEKKYACGTKPLDGMNITVNRDDLKQLRKERLLTYSSNLKASDGKSGGCCSESAECCSSASGCCSKLT